MNESGNIFYDEMMTKLQYMEDALIDVQNGVYDDENINEIFRSIHTVKGTADLLGMIEVVSITHKAEDLLEEVREGNVTLDNQLCSLFIDLKNLLVILVDQVLNFIDMDSNTKSLLVKCENELLSYMPQPAEKHTILILDNSRLIREMLRHIIESEGYNVITIDNSDDAFDIILDNQIDLIFCDISTPYIKSIEMFESLQQELTYEDIPIIMLCDEKNDELFTIAKKLKAKAWLLKKFNKHKIITLIDKILN